MNNDGSGQRIAKHLTGFFILFQDFDGVTAASIRAVIDVSGISEEGTYAAIVRYQYPDSLTLVEAPESINVSVSLNNSEGNRQGETE